MDTAGHIAASRFKPTQNFYVFVICLTIAIFFWLLNVLSKSYTTVIYLPVKYDNMPADRVAMNQLPESFAVKADVVGYNLLFQSDVMDDTIRVDAKYFRNIKKGGHNLSFYHVSPLLKHITTNNYSGYVVSEVLIDTLFIDFDKKITKVLKVNPNIEVDLARQYEISGEIKLLPEAIKVSGPKSILDSVKILQSDPLVFNEVNNNITAALSFEMQRDERFVFMPKNVLATIEVEKNTEATIEAEIEYLNVPDNVVLRTFPNKVNITYLVSISKYESVEVSDFKMVVDYNDIAQNNSKLTVKAYKSPNFVTITRINPARVEYIIKK